jgi:phosphoribosyl 1,2-cyclic phosphate phosphodiesterase
MRITFLGTGTSHGIPVIGCDCEVCKSENQKNMRTRSSILIEVNDRFVLVDTATELRMQILRENIRQIDAVLFTHCHADHVCGFDDLRRFSELSGHYVPCYGSEKTLSDIKKMFEYVFVKTQIGGGKPKVTLHTVSGEFHLFNENVIPIRVYHGKLSVLGYRIGNFAYVTDCSHIPEDSCKLLSNLDILVLGALRNRPHPTHFNLSEALQMVERLEPKRAFFTHICHDLEHDVVNSMLPPNIELAYDSLTIDCI